MIFVSSNLLKCERRENVFTRLTKHPEEFR